MLALKTIYIFLQVFWLNVLQASGGYIPHPIGKYNSIQRTDSCTFICNLSYFYFSNTFLIMFIHCKMIMPLITVHYFIWHSLMTKTPKIYLTNINKQHNVTFNITIVKALYIQCMVSF